MHISHFEPIHFDVFMEMAKSKGINAVALKTKMRAFLDKQVMLSFAMISTVFRIIYLFGD